MPDLDPVRFRLALAQMPARLRGARRRFRNLTGLTAVISLSMGDRDRGTLELPPPPVHPLCVERLRAVHDAPCEQQWQHHLQASRESLHSHSHTCPLGLRCACVPIYLGGSFVGAAKLVLEDDESIPGLSQATATLALLISLSCHESYVSVLRGELQARRVHTASSPPEGSPGEAHSGAGGDLSSPIAGKGASDSSVPVVDLALEYLHQHYQEADLSLRTVAEAVGCNGKYLTYLFTRIVGQRMRGYLLGLRIDRARRELVQTGRPVKHIAYAAGFGDAGQLARAFHRHVGVTPSVYRRLFTAV